MFGDRKLSAPKSASLSVASKRRNFLSASLSHEAPSQQQQQSNQIIERTIYRSTSKFAGDENECDDCAKSELSAMDQVSVCSSALSSEIGKKLNTRAATARVNKILTTNRLDQLNEDENEGKKSRLRKMSRLERNSVDWPCLGEKIENWFEMAKTPDQRVVYGFLNDIKAKENQNKIDAEMREINSATPSMVKSKSSELSDKAQSLEDILRNLKKYRTKFTNSRCSRPIRAAKHERNEEDDDVDSEAASTTWTRRADRAKSAAPARQLRDNFTCTTLDKEMSNRVLESTTWRVMRHLRSADIRSKYPLPKANPDFHFRNSTIFVAAGRPPRATFLLHPDWV